MIIINCLKIPNIFYISDNIISLESSASLCFNLTSTFFKNAFEASMFHVCLKQCSIQSRC